MYEAGESDMTGKFRMVAEFNKEHKNVLLKLSSPRYGNLYNKNQLLSEMFMNDQHTKSDLPVHVILVTSKYSYIKIILKAKISVSGELVAE